MTFRGTLLAFFVFIYMAPFAVQADIKCSQSTNFSDKLPYQLVQELFDLKLWKIQFESSSSKRSEMNRFWNRLAGDSFNVDQLVDNIFGADPDASFDDRLPELYPVKVYILRYFKDAIDSNEIITGCGDTRHIMAGYQAWMKRYVYDLAIPSIERADIEEYSKLVQIFKSRLESGEIELIDLSPKQRQLMKSITPERHHHNLTAINEHTGRHGVAGFYSPKDKVFALDFARPRGETLITFAHELVHAADPQIDESRARIKALYNPVIKILERWLSIVDNPNHWARTLTHQVLFEMTSTPIEEEKDMTTHAVEFVDTFLGLIDGKIEELSDALDVTFFASETPERFDPSEEEIETVKEFLRHNVRLSLENEYKAYGLSAILFYKLNKSWLLPPSQTHREDLKKLAEGDQFFASTIYLEKGISPFPHMRDSLEAENADEIDFEVFKEEVTEEEKQQLLKEFRISKVLNQLEALYLDEVKAFVEQLDSQFSSSIQWMEQKERENLYSQLPYYARPGETDETLNPYTMLAARLTTAWLIRFKNNLQKAHNYFLSTNTGLVSLNYGITDLSDLSVGEQQLVGIRYKDGTVKRGGFSWNDDSDISGPDLSDIPDSTRQYFDLVEWTGNPRSDTPLSAEDLTRNLVGLRMINTFQWLDDSFPVYHKTLVGMENFSYKLLTGNYNQDELDETRATELTNEIRRLFQESLQTRQEIDTMSNLFRDLGHMTNIAESKGMYEMANRLNDRISLFESAMEGMNIKLPDDKEAWSDKKDRFARELDSQLAQAKGMCERMSRGSKRPELQPKFLVGPIKVDNYEFSATAICIGKQLFLLRQPNDRNTGFGTDLVTPRGSRQPVPEVNNLVPDGRPFLLNPYQGPVWKELN